MDKAFICLANSYKLGNRCIAGVEIEYIPQRNTYSVKRDANDNPIWFRPINRETESGAIPNAQAMNISILDIVIARDVVHHPEGAQKENYFYDRLEIVSSVPRNAQTLDCFIDNFHDELFGNHGLAVPPCVFGNLDYSVMLIRCTNARFYLKDRTEFEKTPQPRGIIEYNNRDYDLPVTDPEFRHIIRNNLATANSYDVYYITLSLGLEHEEWHSKLIAGVIGIARAD